MGQGTRETEDEQGKKGTFHLWRSNLNPTANPDISGMVLTELFPLHELETRNMIRLPKPPTPESTEESLMNRPLETEYAPAFQDYVARVSEDDILPALRSQVDALDLLLDRVTPERETYAYAEGKWSIRELVGHLIVGARTGLHNGRSRATSHGGFVSALPS